MQVRGTVVENLATGFATYRGTGFVPGDRCARVDVAGVPLGTDRARP
jgi:hypothetical protein